MMHRFLICAICAIGLFSACTSPAPEFTNGLLSHALKKARDADKYLFVVASNSGCGSCDQYINKVLKEKSVLEAMDGKFDLLRCEKTTAGNEALFYVSASNATPVTYIFSPSGNLVGALMGDVPMTKVRSLILSVMAGRPNANGYTSRILPDNKGFLKMMNAGLEVYEGLQSGRLDSVAAV